MLITLLGWFWIFSGGYFLIVPHRLISRLQSKGIKTIRRLVFSLFFLFNSVLISYIPRTGIRIVVFFLITIAFIKLFSLIKTRYLRTVLECSEKIPPYYYRLGAIFYILAGYFILKSSQ